MSDAQVGTKRPRAETPCPFDPAVHLGLSPEFVLTDYARLKGCSCKVPQQRLLELLVASSITARDATTPAGDDRGGAVVGLDCSVVPLPFPQFACTPTTGRSVTAVPNPSGSGAGVQQQQPLYLVSTTDFFFPSVEDPYIQGVVACANVLSDLHAMGIDRCDSLLMLLASSTEMDEQERFAVTRAMMQGFGDTARLAGTTVTGGQTVMNPWPLIGGVGTSVVPAGGLIMPDAGLLRPGQVLVLTKPLGNQVAVNVKQWVKRPSPLYEKAIRPNMTAAEIEALYEEAVANMCQLNNVGARLMRKFGAVGCTDVTGFGLLGHGRNLAAAQDAVSPDQKVTFVFTALPVLAGAVKASHLLQDKYKLFTGESAETSGGLLIVLDSTEVAERFIREYEAEQATVPLVCGEGRLPLRRTGQAWIVGSVESRGSRAAAIIAENVKVLPVSAFGGS